MGVAKFEIDNYGLSAIGHDSVWALFAIRGEDGALVIDLPFV